MPPYRRHKNYFFGCEDIIGTNLLTKFHEDRKINVASRVLTRIYYSHIRKNAPPPGSHVFQPTGIIFQLIQDIIWMNLLTKFHEDRTVNVASREKCPAPWKPFFQANIIIFELIQDIIETNLLTKFHEDWTINVASRVLTRKNAPPLFHDDRKINVNSRVLTRKRAPPLWWPYIIGMNLLTEFHEDRTINVASREKCPAPWQPCHSSKHWTINVASRVLTRKNAPPPGGHVFQPTGIIFALIQDTIGRNLVTKKNAPPLGSHVFKAKFHEDRKINVASRVKNAPPPGVHVFQPTGIIFNLVQDIIGMNLLTKFHEDRTVNVASRVKNAPPLGSHVFQASVTIFKLIQDIIEINLLTKFHEDLTINVASRE
ncbi:hypothetical protein DPMN_092301 [Dreissena polymorpha]|uniref:Uncharacterized protein n=1 Tax=Dreissena polymorpha TaxID=45954 RepID=A0A9D4L3D7_DREPO|nr:hypothetical protein DPMN_092301 [Dreissena polymorpha]